MKEIQMTALLCITMAAVLFDLKSGRIPNGVIMTGILWGGSYQVFAAGAIGFLLFLGGMLLPLVIFGGLYYFRMVGAGDIKLLCVIGGFLGPAACFSCITVSILFGGLISLAIMFRRHNIGQRLYYFSDYVSHYSREKLWSSYLDGTEDDAKFSFSVPVLLGVLWYLL